MKTHVIPTILIAVLPFMVLSSCSSPLAPSDDQFSIGQAQAMVQQQQNQERASVMMAGRPSPFLQPLAPLQPIR